MDNNDFYNILRIVMIRTLINMGLDTNIRFEVRPPFFAMLSHLYQRVITSVNRQLCGRLEHSGRRMVPTLQQFMATFRAMGLQYFGFESFIRQPLFPNILMRNVPIRLPRYLLPSSVADRPIDSYIFLSRASSIQGGIATVRIIIKMAIEKHICDELKASCIDELADVLKNVITVFRQKLQQRVERSGGTEPTSQQLMATIEEMGLPFSDLMECNRRLQITLLSPDSTIPATDHRTVLIPSTNLDVPIETFIPLDENSLLQRTLDIDISSDVDVEVDDQDFPLVVDSSASNDNSTDTANEEEVVEELSLPVIYANAENSVLMTEYHPPPFTQLMANRHSLPSNYNNSDGEHSENLSDDESTESEMSILMAYMYPPSADNRSGDEDSEVMSVVYPSPTTDRHPSPSNDNRSDNEDTDSIPDGYLSPSTANGSDGEDSVFMANGYSSPSSDNRSDAANSEFKADAQPSSSSTDNSSDDEDLEFIANAQSSPSTDNSSDDDDRRFDYEMLEIQHDTTNNDSHAKQRECLKRENDQSDEDSPAKVPRMCALDDEMKKCEEEQNQPPILIVVPYQPPENLPLDGEKSPSTGIIPGMSATDSDVEIDVVGYDDNQDVANHSVPIIDENDVEDKTYVEVAKETESSNDFDGANIVDIQTISLPTNFISDHGTDNNFSISQDDFSLRLSIEIKVNIQKDKKNDNARN